MNSEGKKHKDKSNNTQSFSWFSVQQRSRLKMRWRLLRDNKLNIFSKRLKHIKKILLYFSGIGALLYIGYKSGDQILPYVTKTMDQETRNLTHRLHHIAPPHKQLASLPPDKVGFFIDQLQNVWPNPPHTSSAQAVRRKADIVTAFNLSDNDLALLSLFYEDAPHKQAWLQAWHQQGVSTKDSSRWQQDWTPPSHHHPVIVNENGDYHLGLLSDVRQSTYHNSHLGRAAGHVLTITLLNPDENPKQIAMGSLIADPDERYRVQFISAEDWPLFVESAGTFYRQQKIITAQYNQKYYPLKAYPLFSSSTSNAKHPKKPSQNHVHDLAIDLIATPDHAKSYAQEFDQLDRQHTIQMAIQSKQGEIWYLCQDGTRIQVSGGSLAARHTNVGNMRPSMLHLLAFAKSHGFAGIAYSKSGPFSVFSSFNAAVKIMAQQLVDSRAGYASLSAPEAKERWTPAKDPYYGQQNTGASRLVQALKEKHAVDDNWLQTTDMYDVAAYSPDVFRTILSEMIKFEGVYFEPPHWSHPSGITRYECSVYPPNMSPMTEDDEQQAILSHFRALTPVMLTSQWDLPKVDVTWQNDRLKELGGVSQGYYNTELAPAYWRTRNDPYQEQANQSAAVKTLAACWFAVEALMQDTRVSPHPAWHENSHDIATAYNFALPNRPDISKTLASFCSQPQNLPAALAPYTSTEITHDNPVEIGDIVTGAHSPIPALVLYADSTKIITLPHSAKALSPQQAHDVLRAFAPPDITKHIDMQKFLGHTPSNAL